MFFKNDNSQPKIEGEKKLEKISEDNMSNTNDPKNTNSKTLAKIHTSFGLITLELKPETAPKTVENFIKLAESGFYNQTRFHRVIKDFMIQGGDPLSKDLSQKERWGTGGPGYAFADEVDERDNLIYGTLAMANSGKDTNGSQFFIVSKKDGTSWLNGKHTIFGQIVSGEEVLEKIQNSATDEKDRPKNDVLIERIEISGN